MVWEVDDEGRFPHLMTDEWNWRHLTPIEQQGLGRLVT